MKDPFFGNQNGLRELREAVASGVLDLDTFKRHAGESHFGGMITYFASVDWHDHTYWHRTNRVDYVLVPYLYLLSDNDEPRTSRHEHAPSLDHLHRLLAAETIEKSARLAGVQPDPAAYARRIAETILPDAVPYWIGSTAQDGWTGPTGAS